MRHSLFLTGRFCFRAVFLFRPASSARLESFNLRPKQEFSFTKRDCLELAAFDQLTDSLNANTTYLSGFYLSDEIFEVYFQGSSISLTKFKDFCIIVTARLNYVERAALLSQRSS